MNAKHRDADTMADRKRPRRSAMSTPNTSESHRGAGQIRRSHKRRLDDELVRRGLFPDRGQALRSILAHEVKVGDVYPQSGAVQVAQDVHIEVHGSGPYVSRGGMKLAGALSYFHQDVHGMDCIDIGSSTGGFSDCLLQAGARHVTCVDVNYGQLAWKVRTDPRTTVFERTNIRTADPQTLGAPFDILVADLSFIGLAGLAPTFARLCARGSIFIGLIKPQFESAHDETVAGLVVDPHVREETIRKVEQALRDAGFDVTGLVKSPIKGKKAGNVEYLVRAVYTGDIQAGENA